ncbi:MFS transporter [Gordonia humi]|uniref:EmrB/QacA subfamily drug resistance transporter n=1 Tax=Gordonia humi TaxID=686429 RepID=A0A840FAJ2_9ACTN|nr:MFS transporter [Gordonia humi]MBB4137170.1 EmrB/QacA subfamily drug resistance transporter [Gordonia humi]
MDTSERPSGFDSVQRVTTAVVCAATAMLMLDIAVVNTALPAMAREFDAGMGALKWVVDGYTLALATIVLSAGAWSDRVGRRRVFVVGAIGFTAASVLCAASAGMGMLIASRIVQGVAAALLFASSLAVLAAAFGDRRQRTRALAAYGATIGAAFAVGPLLGGVLTELLDWRAIFLINVPIGLAILVGTRRVEESRSSTPRRGDHRGQVAVVVGLGALAYGLVEANDRGWTDPVTVAALGAAAAALIVFVAVQATAAEPMLPLGLFANRAFAGAQIAVFAISASMFAVFVYVTVYLQGVLGLTPIQAGLVYLPGTVVMLFVAGATDRFLAQTPPWLVLSVSLIAVAAGMALMTVGGVHSNGTAMVPGFIVACIGAGAFNPVMSSVILGEGGDDDAGLAAGINDAFRQSGIALGVAALGALLPARSVLAGGSPDEFVDGLHVALWASCGIAVAGAVVAATWMRANRVNSDVAILESPA